MVNWIPLESNPQLITDFSYSVGLKKEWAFHDVLGLDDELLSFVPSPCKAVLFLFPTGNRELAKSNATQIDNIEKNGQHVSKDIFYMKQSVGNACGTIATLHALANNSSLVETGKLTEFLQKVQTLPPDARGEQLGKEDAIQTVSEEAAHQGDTATPAADASTGHHFICFIHFDGHLYEMDGGKPFPINHKETNEQNFLKDTIEIVKENFLKYAPDSLDFSLISLGPVSAEN